MLLWKLSLFLAVLIFTQGGEARGITSAEGGTCLYIANNKTNFPFDCEGPDLAYKCRCKCPAFLGTMLMCIERFSNDSLTMTNGFKYLLDVCEHQALIKYEFGDLVTINKNASSHAIDFHKIENLTTIYHPVNVTDTLYESTYEGVITLKNMRHRATIYGLILLGYWGVIMVFATIANIFQWCFPFYLSKLCDYNLVKWFRRHFICPHFIRFDLVPKKQSNSSFFSNNKRIALESLQKLPIRVHAIVITVYIALVIALCCTKYQFIPRNTVFKCSKGQKFVNYADRTGIIGTMQLPIVFLFSARNNPLIMITGCSYRVFQLYHKWCSRVVLVLIILHATFYLLYVDSKGDYIERWGLLKWRWANASLALLISTCFISLFRARFYEFFQMTHKVLLVFFTIGIWYHCFTLGWIEYIAISFSIWATEYILRIAKIIISGGVMKAKCSLMYETVLINDTADNPIYKDIPHTIRVEVNHSGWWRPFPGAFCWIYFLSEDFFWQSHPFTVVSPTVQQNPNQLVFIIRVENGLTKKMAQYISSKPEAQCHIPMLVEGPYGSSIPFKPYDNFVFVAGGVGMTIVYTIAMDLARTYKAQAASNSDPFKKKNKKLLSIVWMVPSFESLFSFRKEIDLIEEFDGLVELQIFITRRIVSPTLARIYHDSQNTILESKHNAKNIKNTTHKEEYNSFSITANHNMVETHLLSNAIMEQKKEMDEYFADLLNDRIKYVSLNVEQKPSISIEVANYIHKLKGTTAVIACGSSNLNAEVRISVVECLKFNENVDYFEEELRW